jgi:hypothetical protein
MQQIVGAITQRVWARALLLCVFGLPVAFYLLPAVQKMLVLYWIGFFTPGLVIAAVIGFLAWNRAWWLWSSVVAVIATVVLLLPH